MNLNKHNFIYLLLIIFSVYCIKTIATDCDVYKGIVENDFIYKEDLDEVNGNCCRLNSLKCDDQNNIISVNFYFMPCSVRSLFEQLSNLPKLQEVEIDMEEDEPIPSTLQKLTQLKKLKIRYPSFLKNRYNIPNEIGSLVNLEELDLSECNLSGKIPNSIGNLIKLRHLDLSTNHLEGYIPYEFKNLKNLEYLNLSGNILKGFVPPIQSLSSCNIQYNEGMCYLKSSRCRSDLKECSLNEIKTTNNNNNNPKPESGEFENEKDITQTTNDNNANKNSDNNVDNNDDNSSDNYGDKNELSNDKNEPFTDKNNLKNKFLSTFLIVISVGIIIIAVIFLAIYKSGSKKPKFTKFDDGNNNNNVFSGDSADDIEINAQRSSIALNEHTTYSYNYAPQPSPVPSTMPAPSQAPSQAPSTTGGYSVYYPVPSPVPSAAQPSTLIPPSPAIPYVTQPDMAYINPVQPAQQTTYVPQQVSPYVQPQTSPYIQPQTSAYAVPLTTTYAVPVTSAYAAQSEIANPPTAPQPAETQQELDYPIPPPPVLDQERSPDDVLPPYESLNRSLGRQ